MNVIKMNNLGMMRLLMDAANADGGASGTGAAGSGGSSLLNATGGGGAAPDTKGGAAAGAGAASKEVSTAGNVSPSADPNGGAAPDWRHGLPKELQDSAAIRKFTDVSALAGAYVNAEKLIGQKGIPKPGAHSTDQDWANVYKELGLPETVDKYDVKFKEGVSIDKTFMDDFRGNAHKAGILPKQAQAIADWFADKNIAAEADIQKQVKAKADADLGALKTEWGDGYQLNLSRAQAVVKQFGDKDFTEYLDKSGLGNDTRFIKILAKVGGKMFSEDKIIGEAATGGAMTPAQAKQEISKIQGDRTHPYYVKDHAAHANAVAEMERLFNAAYASK